MQAPCPSASWDFALREGHFTNISDFHTSPIYCFKFFRTPGALHYPRAYAALGLAGRHVMGYATIMGRFRRGFLMIISTLMEVLRHYNKSGITATLPAMARISLDFVISDVKRRQLHAT